MKAAPESEETLNEYEAACVVGMSPTLLRYLSSHQVKWKDKRILPSIQAENHVLEFAKRDLIDYDKWLRLPWPAKDNGRPHIPEGIRAEIKREANYECAVCKASGQAGEAAHIEPLNKSRSNHPHNLIWLCATHHTKFDNGCFGPKGVATDIVQALKQALHHFQKMSWNGQAQIASQIASTLALCRALKDRLEKTMSDVEVTAINQAAEQVLNLLPGLATQAGAHNAKVSLGELGSALKDARRENVATQRILETALSFEDTFLIENGLERCPLCEGTKLHNGYDCPVCFGDGVVKKGLRVDLDEFQSVQCQLCEGSGRRDGDSCPACLGDGEIERRISERMDFEQFSAVNCPVCNGEGKWRQEDCPACHGDRQIPRHISEQIDPSTYELVDCPLCDGKGEHQGNDCPVCHSDRQVVRQYADNLDLDQYLLQECPICEGTGVLAGDDCVACGGEKEMLVSHARELDRSLYKMVDCPDCLGERTVDGEECQRCQGEGEVLKLHAERF